jgi:hypothetical protein
MKNIHVIPTEKPSRLFLNSVNNRLLIDFDANIHNVLKSGCYQHIYITLNEEIKDNDNCLDELYNEKGKLIKVIYKKKVGIKYKDSSTEKLIVLTTDPKLIEDGVEAIDDEFLKWFIENPNCDFVKLKQKTKFEKNKSKRTDPSNGVYYVYETIIPKKQVFARIGFSDVVVPIEKESEPITLDNMPDQYVVGYELEDGTECDEEGNLLS